VSVVRESAWSNLGCLSVSGREGGEGQRVVSDKVQQRAHDGVIKLREGSSDVVRRCV
jgi:hypothetical protein